MLGATGAAELRLTRLLEFNGLLAQINHAISVHDTEDTLLQAVCDLAARDARLALAYVARPGADGLFRFIAATGRVQALDDVRISVDPADPLGRGSVGRCWRDGVAQFHDAYAAEATLEPWHDHARAHGLRSTAALPLRRGGMMWGVLAVYHEHEAVFDADLQRLLAQLALDVSRGLDRLELLGREKRNRALRESLLNNALVGIVMTRGRRIVDANAHFVSMLGRDSPRELVGRETRALYPDDESFERVKSLYRELYQTGSAQLTSATLRTRAGAIISCDLSANVVREAGHRLVVWTVVDVTERDRLQKQVAYESLHDTLTGLANRRALRRELPRILARAQRHDRVVALGLIDLDDFKPVNDTFGHGAGDRLLCELAARLGARLRAGDLLVRLGGDEFVVVFEDLDAASAVEQLEHALQRLHEAVATPFALGGRDAAEVSMTMGVALYPQDARDPDALIRQADAAMYQCKQRKHARTQWWGLVAQAAGSSEPETDGDAFDAAAQALLARVQRQISTAGTRFAGQFYAELERDASAAAILRTLSADERAQLLQRQAAHLQFLLDPATSRDAIRQRARHLGLVHALTGVSGAWLSRAQGLYRRLLAEQLNQVALGARERLRTMFVADARLQEDVQVELEVEGATTAVYLDLLAAPLPTPGARWVDVSEAALAELAALPGVLAVLLLRLRPDGVLAVERSAGARALALAELLQTPGCEAVLDARSPRGQGASALAWRNLRIETSASLAQDPRYRGWFVLAGQPATQGLRSSLSVPLVDAAGQVVGVLACFGEWPNQFESPVMRQFARGVKSRWEQLWGLCSAPAPVIAQDEARAYRSRLFDGGLRMHVQPIVDLHDGRLVKVEALARLAMPDGSVVLPARFLPLLGSAELDRLFELGLEQSLDHLVRWDAAGLSLQLALNLAPCTLHEGCARRVDAALRRHAVEPRRLWLELLEGERIDAPEQQRELERLRELGVRLAMDDLGTGYSSLQRLSRLPFDAIKVDRSLLQQLPERPLPTLALLGAIVRMGRDVGVEVVVEGLERDAEIEVARALGADRGQGWAIARPMAPEQLLDWHATRRADGSVGGSAGGVRHALGALACHWNGWRDALAPRDETALHGYLRDLAAAEPQAATWLAQLERGDADSAQLQRWLLERVQRL